MNNEPKPNRREFVKATLASSAALLSTSSVAGLAQAPSDDDLCYLPVKTLSSMLRQRKISSLELTRAFYDRIETVNPKINAIVSLVPREKAFAAARAADKALSNGEDQGALHGIPLALKDTVATRGIATTYGSRLLQANVPSTDGLLAARLRAAGGIFIGKTNVPEFGAGSHTFNKLFGMTRNPYNVTKSAGGSSGGAGAALAAGLLPVADGSDMGGSLRNPGSFNNVVGFRPSIGRVPWAASSGAWQSRLATEGSMGRTVADVACHMDVIAGADTRDPFSIATPKGYFASDLASDPKGLRIAWAFGVENLPFQQDVIDVCLEGLSALQQMGCHVEPASPDMSGGMDAFQVDRAINFAHLGRSVPQENWSVMKDTVRWNIEKGLALGIDDLLEADRTRTRITNNTAAFLEKYDFIVLPTSQCAPFDVTTEWVKEISGQPMHTYIDWMASCCLFTLTGLPSISVPCGFTPGGLPVGLQIVGRFHGDLDVLKLAHAFEQATQYYLTRPRFSA